MPRIQALRVFKNLITSSDHKASAEPYASYPLVLQMNGTGTARQFILKAARLSSRAALAVLSLAFSQQRGQAGGAMHLFRPRWQTNDGASCPARNNQILIVVRSVSPRQWGARGGYRCSNAEGGGHGHTLAVAPNCVGRFAVSLERFRHFRQHFGCSVP
jgi:hypothetical protein